MSPLLLAILFCCGMLAMGLTLRATVGVLRILFIPAAVVAGILGLIVIQACVRIESIEAGTLQLSKELSGWPGTLIAIVFAGLLLEKSSGATFAQAIRRGARSAVLAWIIILGQIVIGLLVYIALVRPSHPDVPASFGQLLEVSWAGGHGASGAMGQVYAAQQFPQGRDLAFFLATMGLVWGVISGLVLVNVAIRRGWIRAGAQAVSIKPISGLEPRNQSIPIAFARTRGEVLEPLALQVVILAAALAAGYGLQRGFISVAALVLGKESLTYISNVPLFLFTLIGGLLVRAMMRIVRIDDLIESASIQRLVGLAMEFLIVSAIASMRIEALSLFAAPLIAMLVLAAVWSAFCLLVLSRQLLPAGYWFELGLLNYGFSTANTPQGMMLLRIIDPELKSGAAEDYAVAAPLSAPFVGGGVITFVVLPQLLQRVAALWVALMLVAILVGLFLLGRRLAR